MNLGHLSLIDWAIVVVAIVGLRAVSLGTRSYMKGVADFLSANRCAGRYLLAISSQMSQTGVIVIIGAFEVFYSSGFTPEFWRLMTIMCGPVIALTGWVYYRFRETRALTMAQFFEMRYNRRFRIFAGIVCWATGVINFGIFPVVAARFFVYFCGFRESIVIPHVPFEIPTVAIVMLIDLALALMFVTMGGQISVMVTECVQGIFTTLSFIVVGAAVLWQFHWPKIAEALSQAPTDASLIHPFHIGSTQPFNAWYYVISVFGTFYGWMAWQGSSGFYSAARTPHEQKMGNIIGGWREVPKCLIVVLLPIAAYAFMHLPEYAGKASMAQATLDTIANPATRGQMQVPIALAYFLPIGVKGLLAVTMLFFSFTCHDSYMHSWGTIFIQDVVVPIRRRPFEPAQHIKLMRWSIIGVAVFSFFFGLFYPQTQMIYMFFAITGTIWMGGAGAVIIGGLYWKRGTTAGAYAALTAGAVLGLAGLIIPGIYKARTGHEFPLNGQQLWCLGMVSASLIYIVVSLATGKGRIFNLEKMLHRGPYADRKPEQKLENRWQRLVGITEEFNRSDKVLAISMLIWNVGWLAVFIVIAMLNFAHPMGNAWWSGFWKTYLWLYFALTIPIAIWLAVGGVLDIKGLFALLKNTERDLTDDGRVIDESEVDPNTEKPANRDIAVESISDAS